MYLSYYSDYNRETFKFSSNLQENLIFKIDISQHKKRTEQNENKQMVIFQNINM